MTPPFEVKKNFLGHYVVGYDCPKCGERLRSPIADAGNADGCPNCQARFIVPGSNERERILRAQESARLYREERQREKRAAEQQQFAELSQLEQEQATLAEAIEQRRQEEQQGLEQSGRYTAPSDFRDPDPKSHERARRQDEHRHINSRQRLRVSLFLFLILGCVCLPIVLELVDRPTPIGPSQTPRQIRQPTPIRKAGGYTIITQEIVPGLKRSLEIRLNEEISEDELASLALEIRDSAKKRYEKTFIGYYLPDMKVNAGYWATTHFNPELEVRILGATKEEIGRFLDDASTPMGDNVIGCWIDKTAFPGVITFLREDGKVFMAKTFQDGSTGKYELTVRTVGGEMRYCKKAGKTSDYMVIAKDGDLAHGDDEGIWVTSPRFRSGSSAPNNR